MRITFNAPANHRLRLTDAFDDKFVYGGQSFDGNTDPEFTERVIAASEVDVTAAPEEMGREEETNNNTEEETDG